MPVTRAESQDDMTFKVEVIDIQSGVIVKTVDDHHTLQNEPIALREGTYIIKASNGTDVEAGFDSFSGVVKRASAETDSADSIAADMRIAEIDDFKRMS